MLESEGMPPKRHGVGDVIFFRGGARATWHVEHNVKKVAFLRQANPPGFGLAIRAVNRLKRMLSRSAAPMLLRVWTPVVILNGSVLSG
jgi:hypothetical protein